MDVVFHFFKKVISLAVFMCFLIGFFLKLQQFALRKEIPSSTDKQSGTFYVSGKLPTYSSFKPTFCPK